MTIKDKADNESVAGGSLGKAILVLGSFIDGQNAWGVRELAGVLDQPTSSVHRILKIMRGYRLVEWEPATQKYRTGPELHRWASVLRTRLKLPALARPVAQALTDELGESTWLALYDREGPCIWYALEVECTHPLRFPAPIGKREKLVESPAGLAVLSRLDGGMQQRAIAEGGNGDLAAALEEIRERGFAVTASLADDTPVLISAPVLEAGGQPVGSLLVAVPTHRFQASEIERLAGPLKSAANHLSGILGARLLTGSQEAGSYRGIAAVANILNERLNMLHLTPWEGGGHLKLNELQEKHAAYGTAVGPDAEAAYLGRPPFSAPHEHLRLVVGLAPLQLHILLGQEVDASTMGDLAGLRVSPGERDYATADAFLKLIRLARPGAEPFVKDGGRLAFVDYGEANRLFQEDRLDALAALNGVPNPNYRTLARKRPFKLFSPDERLLEDFVASNPTYQRTVIPAGSYPGQETDIATLGVPFVIVTTADRNADEVYEFVQTVHQRQRDLAMASPSFGSLQKISDLAGMKLPLHPGAEKFYRQYRG